MHQVHGLPEDVQLHKHFQRFPVPVYTTVQHFQTSSTEHKLLPADGVTAPPLGGLDPAQSLESPEIAAEELQPVTMKFRICWQQAASCMLQQFNNCNRKHTLSSA